MPLNPEIKKTQFTSISINHTFSTGSWEREKNHENVAKRNATVACGFLDGVRPEEIGPSGSKKLRQQ